MVRRKIEDFYCVMSERWEKFTICDGEHFE